MANRENISEVKADLVQVMIGADEAPFTASVEYQMGHETFDVLALRTGNIVGRLTQRAVFTGKIRVMQTHAATLRQFCQADGAAPRNNADPGVTLTPVAMTFLIPGDAGDANQVHGYAVTFGVLKRLAVDGNGPAEWETDFIGVADASGNVWRIGPLN